MILRESSIRSPALRCSIGFGILLLVAIAPGSLLGESPATLTTRADDSRPGRLPDVETRIYWDWPDFLSAGSVRENLDDRWDDPRSMSLSGDNTRSPGKLFGAIDWLSENAAKPGFNILPAPTMLSEPDGWVGSAGFPDLISSSESEITLVRGGPPQLFGSRGRLRAEYGDEFDDVQRVRGQLLLSLIGNYIGIDASGNSWEDSRPQGLGDFWTGDANLVYSMGVQRIAMRGGVGASWVYEDDLEFGFNTTYGADVFLTRPWLVSGEIDYGKINSEKLFHWRATFGVQLLRFEAYIGYDSYQWNHIRFDGPVAGGGLWF